MMQIPTNRIVVIDQSRGIALLGILVFNIQTYGLFALLRPEQVYALGLDKPETYAPLQFVIHLLVKGQFYTIYSFQFGLGFYLMWQKNTSAGLDADRLFKRRLWVLLIFGLIHALVFWFGDVLHKYALLGFSLLYFNKKSIKALINWIAVLLVLMFLLQLVKVLCFPVTPQSVLESRKEFDAVIMQVISAWQNGSALEVMSFQKLGVAMTWLQTISGGLIGILHFQIMFLLGLVVGKTNAFDHIVQLKAGMFKKMLVLFPFALLLKGISCLDIYQIHLLPADQPAWELFIRNVSEGVGTLLLAIVYLLALVIILSARTTRLQRWIANTGRLGLINYLAQTLICMFLFYGYGAGLSGKLSLSGLLIPVISIYIFQVIYSNVWLSYFDTGPMESLWRKLTYSKRKAPK